MSKFEQSAQFISGDDVAKYLDELFRGYGYEIYPTTPHEERQLCLGDRHYLKEGGDWTVEYKSGVQTFYTGNVFLETVSVDSQNKPGWVYTCKANVILYAALLNQKILVFHPDKLREQIEHLKQTFKEVKTSKGQNKGYDTHGVIVPLEYAEQNLASKVILIERYSQWTPRKE